MDRLPVVRRAGPELRRLLVIWLVGSIIASPLVYFFLGPHLPPFGMSKEAQLQQYDNSVMVAFVTPVIVFLITFFGYALTHFRHRGGPLVDGPAFSGDTPTIFVWIGVTFLIVFFLAFWGSFELFPGEDGAGGGQGAQPLPFAIPAAASTALQVQVIGEQWNWSFRFPQYGGVQTTSLELPVNRVVEFHVTSLDVVHSFWAYQLGVKADAVPGTDNIAFVTPVQLGTFSIRCAELCGLWHGHMSTTGTVVADSSFDSWIAQEQTQWAPATKGLPPYAPVYEPQPSLRAG